MNFARNYLTVASIATSLLGLVMIYFSARGIEPEKFSLADLDETMVGSIVSSEGKVSSKSEHEAGHVFLTISSDGAKIQVPIFSSVASRMSGVQRIKVGSSVSVTGRLDEYRGQLQIVPRKAEDVRLVS